MPRSLLGPAAQGGLALAAILVAAIFAALSVGGLLFATAVAIGIILLGTLVAVSDRGSVPFKLGAPGRYAVIAMVAEAGILTVTGVVAVAVEGWAWVPVLVAGSAAVYMIYTNTRPSSALVTADQPGAPGESTRLVEMAEALAGVGLFAGLARSDLVALAELGVVRQVAEGESLGREGQAEGFLYAVLDGRAHLSIASTAGRLTARIAGPGEVFPLATLLGDGKLITSAEASTAMRVWQVDRGSLRGFFRSHPAAGAQVYGKAAEILAERYRSTLWRLTQAASDVVRSDGFWANV